ncbi:unnamed protein product [Schistosoma turkestanicum]|nr:unnamed protein product [Schistosoma turkestanicum]
MEERKNNVQMERRLWQIERMIQQQSRHSGTLSPTEQFITDILRIWRIRRIYNNILQCLPDNYRLLLRRAVWVIFTLHDFCEICLHARNTFRR